MYPVERGLMWPCVIALLQKAILLLDDAENNQQFQTKLRLFFFKAGIAVRYHSKYNKCLYLGNIRKYSEQKHQRTYSVASFSKTEKHTSKPGSLFSPFGRNIKLPEGVLPERLAWINS